MRTNSENGKNGMEKKKILPQSQIYFFLKENYKSLALVESPVVALNRVPHDKGIRLGYLKSKPCLLKPLSEKISLPNGYEKKKKEKLL